MTSPYSVGIDRFYMNHSCSHNVPGVRQGLRPGRIWEFWPSGLSIRVNGARLAQPSGADASPLPTTTNGNCTLRPSQVVLRHRLNYNPFESSTVRRSNDEVRRILPT